VKIVHPNTLKTAVGWGIIFEHLFPSLCDRNAYVYERTPFEF